MFWLACSDFQAQKLNGFEESARTCVFRFLFQRLAITASVNCSVVLVPPRSMVLQLDLIITSRNKRINSEIENRIG